jgi:Uma2 family endonuclease
VLELDATVQIIHRAPTGGDTGARNGELVFQLKTWVSGIGGWQVFASSTGFRLPDSSVLSPDASLGAHLGWLLIPAEQAVEIWQAHGAPQRLEGAALLDGGALLPRLHLDLTAIWQV